MNTSALLDDKLTNSTGKDRIRQVFVDHWGKMSLGAGVAMSMYGLPTQILYWLQEL